MASATLNTEKLSLSEVIKKMYLLRFTEEKMLILSRQSNSGVSFQLSGAGHELVGLVAGQHLIPEQDWSFPYYRDHGFPLGLGCSLEEIIGSFLARDSLHHSSGRMMPYHYSHKRLRICCQSSVVGTQFLQAAGRAWAVKNSGYKEVVYVSGGDGATSQGEFHEMLNFVSLHRLPLITVIQNNQWAISVPFKDQCGVDLATLGRSYGLDVYSVSGSDLHELNQSFQKAVEKAREECIPALIIAEVERLQPHSNSDNHETYRNQEELKKSQDKDPLKLLVDQYLATCGSQEELEVIKVEAKKAVEKALQVAEAMPVPDQSTCSDHLFAPVTANFTSQAPDNKELSEPKTMRDAITEAIREEMERDAGVIVFGEDVADNKGGVFGVTRGLANIFGNHRCFNTPLAEATIIGAAIGMAFDGIHKPVVEIQFADYIWPGINQLFSEASSIHYRSYGQWEVPMVIRTTCGGYIQGGPYHSQNIEGFLAHCPGIKVVYPSNAADAKALLKSSIRDTNPVVFLEHKALYQKQTFSRCPTYSSEYIMPLGKANIVHHGTDITVVSWGMTLVLSLEIAQELEKEGLSIEVIDLRTIIPCDFDTIIESVKKTSKVLIIQEAQEFCSFGSEIAATVSEQAYKFLDAPVQRLSSLNLPVPYNKMLEREVLPQKEDIIKTIKRLIAF